MTAVYWRGKVPPRCQVRPDRAIEDEFVDGAMRSGAWACMHPLTHEDFGVGLGTGRGQRYRRQEDGRWLRVEG